MREGKRHRRQALGGRVDDHHRVALPRLAGLPVADTAPEIHDLLAVVIGAAGAAQFSAAAKFSANASRTRLEAGLTRPSTRGSAADMIHLASVSGKRRASRLITEAARMFEREQQDEGDRATVQFDFVEESPRVRNFPQELYRLDFTPQ